jgi:hypothetical protein
MRFKEIRVITNKIGGAVLAMMVEELSRAD